MSSPRVARLALLVLGGAVALGCEAEPSSEPSSAGRGVSQPAPVLTPPPTAESPTFRVDRNHLPSLGSGGGARSTPATSPATAVDGGLPQSDGGAPPSDDTALAATVESHGRDLARCFPASMSTLPSVSLEFQISVSGLVTRTEALGEGVDPSVRSCLTTAAASIHFPAQSSVRSYRYPMMLRRTPAPDGGTAPR